MTGMPTATVDDVRLWYQMTGTGDPPMVFIHGWCCDHTHFAPQIEHFSRGHRVLAVDLRGHGASDKPECNYTIAQFADDVAAVCQEADVTGAVVVGHSMGGVITLTLAARHPELVKGAVLVDAPVFLPEAIRAELPGFIEALGTPAYREAARGFIEAMLFLPSSDPDMRARITEGMVAAPQHVMSSAFTNIIADYSATAAQVRCPVLSIDAALLLNDMERFQAAMPGLQVERLADAGHFCQLEAAGQVNAAIERFMELLEAEG
jgi:pimeloyl-ACP methyl ester carboxylesterase